MNQDDIIQKNMRKLHESFSKKDIATIFSNNSNKFTPYDNTLPSLKLLSKVFGRNITEVEMYEKPSTLRLAGEFDGFRQRFFFNKHELVHKCKSFIMNNYKLSVHTFNNIDGTYTAELHARFKSEGWSKYVDGFNRDTEEEAVFEATQFVLENVK